MGSSARARCDLAMMAAERVNGSSSAKQQMEVGTQQQPSNSLKGPADASVVRSERAKASYHRRCKSHGSARWTPSVPRPIPQRQLKKKSTTSPCLEMVGYVVTARNAVPPMSVGILWPKGSPRFAHSLHPTRNPFARFEPPAFIRIFWFSAPARVCFQKSYLPRVPHTNLAAYPRCRPMGGC